MLVCFLLGNFPASEFYMPTFRNTLFHLQRQIAVEWNQCLLVFFYVGIIGTLSLQVAQIPFKWHPVPSSDTLSFQVIPCPFKWHPVPPSDTLSPVTPITVQLWTVVIFYPEFITVCSLLPIQTLTANITPLLEVTPVEFDPINGRD
jgi:hypothetical protein